ncbi:MAG: DMT family transporter [Sulfitobacter sp.]
MQDHAKGLLITILGVLFVVPDSLFVRLIAVDPLTIAFWRQLNIGLLLGAAILLWQGTAPFRALMTTGWSGVIYGVATGASGLLFVLAVSLTSVANVVFIIASMPVFAMIFSRIALGEPITARMLGTICAVAAGLGIIAYGSGETHGASWRGDVLALGVSALFAMGLTAARRVKHVSMVAALPIAYLLCAAAIAPFAGALAVAPQLWPLLAGHAAFITLASIFLALGPRYITSAEVSLLVLVESVLAPLLVWYVLGEDPGGWAVMGGAVVLGALLVSNLIVLRRRGRRLA